MRPIQLSLCMALALSCEKTAIDPGPIRTSSSSPSMGTAQLQVGSAAFHAEIGNVYERYGDHKSAIDHLSQATSLAQDSPQRVQVYSALGRVKEAAGDPDGAIDALEQALANMKDASAAGPPAAPQGLALAGPVGDDVLLRLASLYAEKGQYDQAGTLCERALLAAREPWQREQLYRLKIGVHRKAGTLEKELAAKERTLEEPVPDESALRFLAIALAGDAMPDATAGGSQADPQAASKLVRVYERLYELHPDDLQVRQTLQSLLERGGRIEDAVKLA